MEYKPEPKIHSGLVELAVVNLMNFRIYTIVPNISHGLLGNMEADLLCYDGEKFTEVEIKISASDLKADFNKKHGHRHKYVSRLIYAMPLSLCGKYSDIIPKENGIISVAWNGRRYEAKHYRKARHKKGIADFIPDHFVNNFMRLGCMRIWSLKQKLYNK